MTSSVTFRIVGQQTFVSEFTLVIDSVLPDVVGVLRSLADFFSKVLTDEFFGCDVTIFRVFSVTLIKGTSEGIDRLNDVMNSWVLKFFDMMIIFIS